MNHKNPLWSLCLINLTTLVASAVAVTGCSGTPYDAGADRAFGDPTDEAAAFSLLGADDGAPHWCVEHEDLSCSCSNTPYAPGEGRRVANCDAPPLLKNWLCSFDTAPNGGVTGCSCDVYECRSGFLAGTLTPYCGCGVGIAASFAEGSTPVDSCVPASTDHASCCTDEGLQTCGCSVPLAGRSYLPPTCSGLDSLPTDSCDQTPPHYRGTATTCTWLHWAAPTDAGASKVVLDR